jgi:hypothetical protein
MFAIALAAAVLLGAADTAPKLDFTYELDKKEDALVTTVEKDRVILLVTSKSGIGGVSVAPRGGKWPKNVVLRLRYEEGRGFGSLEGFWVTSPQMSIEGSLKDSGSMRASPGDDQKKAIPIKVTAEVKDGFLEICLPADTLTGAEKARVRWIDAFRR